MFKDPFDWSEIIEDNNWRQENEFFGCLVRIENWRDFVWAQVFSHKAHQKPISPIWRENTKENWEIKFGLCCVQK